MTLTVPECIRCFRKIFIIFSMGSIGNVLNSTGKNPIIQLEQVVPEGSGEVHVLLGYLNPSGSVKDRIAPSRTPAPGTSPPLCSGTD